LYTIYQTAKFDRPTFSRSEVIMRINTLTSTLTNKQTPLKTSTSLRYATPVVKITVFASRLQTTSTLQNQRHI